MAWTIYGNRPGLTLEVGKSGSLICHGTGLHDAGSMWGESDAGGLHRLHRCALVWTVTTPNAESSTFERESMGPIQRAQKFPATINGTVQRLTPHAPETIAVIATAPRSTFFQIRKLLDLVLLSESLHYEFHLWFEPRPETSAKGSGVTLQDFLDGKPLFLTGLSFQISSGAR